MRCPVCGSTVSTAQMFCTRCGARLDAATGGAVGAADAQDAADGSVTTSEAAHIDPGDTAPLPTISEDEDFLHQESLHTHFSEAQEESKKRLPIVLVVVMFVLFAIAVSTLAIATYYIYENYVEPIIRELVMPTLSDDEAEQDAGGTDQGTTAAGAAVVAPAAPAQPNAAPPANTQPADGGGTVQQPADDGGGAVQPPAPVAPEDDPAQQAVYNDLLAAYRDAEAQNWQNALGSKYQDLSSLGAVMITHTDTNVSVPYDRVESGTVSYAYVDFGDDGTLDLAIAAVQDDGSYDLLGLFNTDGTEPISIMNGAVSTRQRWRVRDDLSIERSGAISGWEWEAVIYEVSESSLVTDGAYGYDESGYWSEDAAGTRTSITFEEYDALRNSAVATLAWQPLSEFTEVEVEVDEDAAGDAGQAEEEPLE